MMPHASPSRKSSFKPLPPPPPTSNEQPNPTPIPTTSPSTTPSPRIRRKPLPASAFSPQSIASSPISIRFEREDNTRDAASTSGETLNNILDSPSNRSNTTRRHIADLQSFTPIPPLPQPKPIELRQDSLPKISIPDFPLPPTREVTSHSVANEDIHISVTSEEDMAPRTAERPPPLRMDSIKALKTLDARKPQSPGSVFTSFFARKTTPSPQNVSPGVESAATDISDSQAPSPYVGAPDDAAYFAPQYQPSPALQRQPSFQSSRSSNNTGLPVRMNSTASGFVKSLASDSVARCNTLEAELRELSRELAGSIRRELDLEDLVEKLQAEHPLAHMSADRTSDYFSDSGTSSVRHPGSEYNSKEEMEKIKRESEQQRAQLKVDLSQKWQNEMAQRQKLESHVQILENKLSLTRQTTNETSDASARIRELEVSLDDARRRLVEERQTKENFEDLLTALRVDLEQHRNERDNLLDETVPKLRSQIEGLESSFGDSQKQAYEFARMQQEIQSLRDENAAITSARKMEQEIMRSGMHFSSDSGVHTSPRSSLVVPQSTNTNRSSTISSRVPPPMLNLSRSGSLSRPNSLLYPAQPETPSSLTDRLSAVEQQRDALHSAVKYLRQRYDHQTKLYEKKIHVLDLQVQKLSSTSNETHRGGYEKEVRALRQEINLLRQRADDALDQKWQCEKGLSGLKMDLDRSKQETASLQKLLGARNDDDPEQLSAALENAMKDLETTQAHCRETAASLSMEQRMAQDIQESAKRAEALATQVRQQLDANASLRGRLMTAVASGERNQQMSASQISELQTKLKRLEDTITTTHLQSETSVLKHEEEIRVLKASHNALLLRVKTGVKSPTSGQILPLSPMFASRSPKLDTTSSGPGMALTQAMKTEVLENKVAELERALRDAESEMEEVVGRMNKAQIEVFELQQERDEEHKRTQKLEHKVKAERERFQTLVANSMT